MENRYKKLAKNTLIFSISNFASKLLIFFMLPLYTSQLTPEQFGLGDLLTTISIFVISIVTFGLLEGLLKFVLKKSNDLNYIFRFSFIRIMIGIVFFLALSPILLLIDSLKEYIFLFIVYTIITIIENYFAIFVRGLDKIKLIGIMGVVATFVTIFCNILFLVVFKFGIYGFVLSYSVASFVNIICYFFFGKLYLLFKKTNNEKQLGKGIEKFCLPLIIYRSTWTFSTMINKIFLERLPDNTQLGLYAAANRVQSIPKTLEGIFSQAWTISAIADGDDKDYIEYCSFLYTAFNFIMVLICMGVSMIIPFLAKILFAAEFYEAWKCVPFMMIGVVFSSLFGFIQPILAANGNSKIVSISAAISIIISIPLNYFASLKLGAIGIAIVSGPTFFLMWLIEFIAARKHIKLKISLTKDFIGYLLLISAALNLFFVENIIYSTSINACILIMFLILNFKLIKKCCIKLLTTIKNKKAAKEQNEQ